CTTENIVSVICEREMISSESIPEGIHSLSSLRISGNERVILPGDIMYSLCSSICFTTPRISLCALINGEEVTIANLISGKIETVEISLFSEITKDIELFIVGEGEIELVGCLLPYDNPYTKQKQIVTGKNNE